MNDKIEKDEVAFHKKASFWSNIKSFFVVRSLRHRVNKQEAIIQELANRLLDYNNRLETLEINVRNNNSRLAQLDDLILRAKICDIKIEDIKADLDKIGQIKFLDDTIRQKAALHQDDVDNQKRRSEKIYNSVNYFDFENHFRGSEAVIKQRQIEYLKYFEKGSTVLDLGCGRGEFLELLNEFGVTAIGVDFYDEFVVYCRCKGLTVFKTDAIDFLKEYSGIANGIFAGQLVEHLDTEQIICLCKTAYRKLSENGILIMETPNPRSLAIYTNAFYIDPSHNKPIHPLTLKYFAEQAGFNNVDIVFTKASRINDYIPKLESDTITNINEFNDSMKRVSELLYGSQDYAVIARKTK